MRESFSVRFYLNPTKARSGKYQIYARIIVDREKAEVATGLFVKENDWFPTEGKARTTAINDEISEIEACLRKLRRKILDGNGILTAKVIKAHYKGDKRFNIGIKEYFNKHKHELELLEAAKKISEGTVKHYRTSEKHLGTFLQLYKKGADVGINEIDYSFINEFDLYLKSKYKSKSDKSISNNYANKQHSRLRTVLHKAVREGFINANPYQTFRLKAEKAVRDYLTEGELNSLSSHSLQGNLSLQRVRDCFLFSCYTGLRYEDAFNLKMTDINYETDGTVSLTITMGKTNDRVYVPLLEPAIRIMAHYSDDDARKVFNFVLPRYSNQKVNTYLKTIVDLAGINKELTHHVARHTCATLLLNKGMPIEVVQKILGHADIRTTKIYARMLNTTVKDEMAKVSKLL
jgi:integrase/recombinase XerD